MQINYGFCLNVSIRGLQNNGGFGVETNVVTIITKDNNKQFEQMDKEDVAKCLLDEILSKNL